MKNLKSFGVLMLLLSSISILSFNINFMSAKAQQQSMSSPSSPELSKASPPPASEKGKVITVNDHNLRVDVVFRGLSYPSNMAFLGQNDILVLEKTNGTVKRIVNGTMMKDPLLDVNVAINDERGMLGIAIAKHKNGPTYVFLYFTETVKDGDDASEGKNPLGNRLYRYELQNNKLVNAKLLLDLPAIPGPHHNAGNVLIGPDENLYVAIGDLEDHRTQSQNVQNGSAPDGTSGILRLSQDGKVVQGIFGDKFPLNLYYAFGIRNSFGMDFDPLTKKLWDTENGPGFGDENKPRRAWFQ